MKSPTRSVGFIEPDGILKGSIQNERMRNTTTITGKNARAMSTTIGSASVGARRRRANFASYSQSRPVITAASSRTAAKSVNLSMRPITAMKSTGQATSRMPFRVSVRPDPPRAATQSQPIRAKLPTAAIVAINSQSSPCCISGFSLLALDLQDGEERLLRDLDASHLLHPLLAGFLLFEELPLSRDVAAIALGEHVLAQGLDVLARHHVGSDRRLHRHVEHLARNELAHARGEVSAAVLGALAVHDQRQRVDLVAVDEDVEPHEVAGAEFPEFVVERRIAARVALQLVEEIHHDLVQRHVVGEDHLAAHVLHG